MTSLSSSTHPDPAAWYASSAATFTWDATDPSGVGGYSYVIDASASTTPDAVSDTAAKTVTVPGVATGSATCTCAHATRSATGARRSTGPSGWTRQPPPRLQASRRRPHRQARFGFAWGTVTDPSSGLDHYTVHNKTTGATFTVAAGTTSYLVTGLAPSTAYTFYVTATDAVGNTSVKSAEKSATTLAGSGPDTFTSIAGANRYATAVAVSKKAFPAGADAVVIATGENWPDALGGSALAGALGGPILLTRRPRCRVRWQPSSRAWV